MINRLHSVFHRPERGWDPVPLDYAERYAQMEWAPMEKGDVPLIDHLTKQLGGFKGKRVLDLGGGPGQYSVAFAQQGAHVTWHDISYNYLRIAQGHVKRAKVKLEFSIGYLEDAKLFLDRPFDLVFVRACWSYCMNDRAFARMVYSLIKPGGAGYIDAETSEFEKPKGLRRLVYFLNRHLQWKVGHPFPPRGRVAILFQCYPIEHLTLDYSSPIRDKVFFIKSRDAVP